MKKLFATALIAIVLTASTAFALDSFKMVQGTVRSVDPTGNTVTLVGGRTLMVGPNVSTQSLRPGQRVTISYQDATNGQEFATHFWIDQGPGGTNSN